MAYLFIIIYHLDRIHPVVLWNVIGIFTYCQTQKKCLYSKNALSMFWSSSTIIRHQNINFKAQADILLKYFARYCKFCSCRFIVKLYCFLSRIVKFLSKFCSLRLFWISSVLVYLYLHKFAYVLGKPVSSRCMICFCFLGVHITGWYYYTLCARTFTI